MSSALGVLELSRRGWAGWRVLFAAICLRAILRGFCGGCLSGFWATAARMRAGAQFFRAPEPFSRPPTKPYVFLNDTPVPAENPRK